MTSLTVNAGTKSATFTGKASIQDVSQLPVVPYTGFGNAILQAEMTDIADPGEFNDLLALTVWKDGGIWFSSSWNGRKTEQQTINRSNLLISTNNSLKSAMTEIEISQFVKQDSLKVYPNPFTDKLRFEFVSATDASALLDIYDATGRKVKTIFEGPVAGEVYYNIEFKPENSASGFYLYRLVLGDKVYNGKVLYQK